MASAAKKTRISQATPHLVLSSLPSFLASGTLVLVHLRHQSLPASGTPVLVALHRQSRPTFLLVRSMRMHKKSSCCYRNNTTAKTEGVRNSHLSHSRAHSRAQSPSKLSESQLIQWLRAKLGIVTQKSLFKTVAHCSPPPTLSLLNRVPSCGTSVHTSRVGSPF